jgi:hypothetical protein
MILPILVALSVAEAWAQSPAELREMARVAMNRMTQNSERLADYGYSFEGRRREYHSDGKLKSEESWKGRRDFIDGFGISRIVERNGKPIEEKERRERDQTIAKRLAEFRAMSPDELEKLRLERREKAQKEMGWVTEFADAFDFKLAGEQMLEGRPVWLIDFEPRSGFRASSSRARLFEKIRGRLWLDKTDTEIMRAEGVAFDSVSIGWGLVARIEKGTKFEMERRKVKDGLWLNTSQSFQFAARLMLVKNLSNQVTNRWSGFRHKSEFSEKAN